MDPQYNSTDTVTFKEMGRWKGDAAEVRGEGNAQVFQSITDNLTDNLNISNNSACLVYSLSLLFA